MTWVLGGTIYWLGSTGIPSLGIVEVAFPATDPFPLELTCSESGSDPEEVLKLWLAKPLL